MDKDNNTGKRAGPETPTGVNHRREALKAMGATLAGMAATSGVAADAKTGTSSTTVAPAAKPAGTNAPASR